MSRTRGAPALATAAVVGWQVWVPSPWRDEGATWLAARRSVPDLLALARHVDLVHLGYYLVAHLVLQLDDSIVALRLLSVLATAVTAGLLVLIGRRSGSLQLGVLAGLLVAVSPLASRYGQEARPYALAATAATAATLALLAALDQPGRRRWWLYAGWVLLTGLLDVLALTTLAGHALLVRFRRPGPDGAVELRRWAVATGAALVLLAPFAVATFAQRGQVGWLRRPGPAELESVLAAPWNGLAVPALLLATTPVLALLSARRGGRWRPDPAHRQALLLGVGGGLLPVLLLWTVSQVHPLFDGRYLVAALPGTALALAGSVPVLAGSTSRIGGGIGGEVGGRRRELVRLAVPVLLLGIGSPAQVRYRDPASGHAEDVRGAVRILSAGQQPGDGVLFVPAALRIVTLMYPDEAAHLDDVALARDPVASATLTGTDRDVVQLATALIWYRRIWLVTGQAGPGNPVKPANPVDAEKVRLLDRDFTLVDRRQVPHFTIELYRRRP